MRSIAKRGQRQRPLHFEVLEDRLALSAAVGSLEVSLPTLSAAKKPTGSPYPYGYTPAQIRLAYHFDDVHGTAAVSFGGVAGDGTGQTIAIVDAYSDPTIVSDLATFDQTFGLPAPPNFTIVNQTGGTKLPKANKGWAQEIALDVEWAHAIAPGANILLVEAKNASNLGEAVDYARRAPGVSVVSLSAAGTEYKSEAQADALFTTPFGHAGVTFVVSSGDEGAKPEYPSSSPNVLSVGGTLLHDPGGQYTFTQYESAWLGGGGGVSKYEGVPSFQNGLGLTTRGTPDVAYDADPNSGFAVYDSYGTGGWGEFGGTSAGAPQWAALLAIADQGRAIHGLAPLANAQAALYQMPSIDFWDVSVGNNGNGSNAHQGYDTATGLGSPRADVLVPDLAVFTGSTYFTVAAIPKPAKGGKAAGKSPKAYAIENPLVAGGLAGTTSSADRSELQASAWARYDAPSVLSKPAAGGGDLISLSPRVADEAFSASDLRTAARRLTKRTASAFASADDSSIAGIDGFFAGLNGAKLVAAPEQRIPS